MGEPIRVLHVDDEPDFTEVTAKFLERRDDRFDVETVATPTEGLDRLAEHEFDCVVSDYEMSEWTGIEFLQAVREAYPDLPFLLFTGKGSEEIASEAISAGVTDYLQKQGGPDQYTVLANRIENAVDRYRTEQELDATRNRYRQIVEQNLAGIYIIQNGEIAYVNPKITEIFGYEQEELVGMSPVELIAPEERDRVRKNLRRRFEGEIEEIQYQTVALTKTGDRVDVELHGSRIEYEGQPAVIGTLVDITERKKHEQELRQQQTRLSIALEGANAGVWEWEVETDEVIWHESTERLFGLDPGEFDDTYEAFAGRVHAEDLANLEAAIEDALPGREPFEAEYRIRHEDGEWRWVYARAEFVDSEDLTPRYIGVITDITELKQHERELERQNERLEEFASVVSHDLRNPLNVAVSRLELAQEEVDCEHFEPMDRALDRMDTLIEDLLTLAREGKQIQQREPVDLAEIVEDCWLNVETGDATIRTEVDRRVVADPSRLQQLLTNLVQNAVKHGGSGVTITVGELADGFYVEDDGPGIPPEERDDVFDTGYSTVEEGVGFGLAIVETIAEAHGWEIRVTDGTDGGARFEITDVEFAS